MISNLFCVYDLAAGMYLDPFVAPSIEFAIRSFREAANDPDHQFSRFPEDYTLFHIGEFDGETGIINPNVFPASLGVAVTFVNRIQLEGEA